MRYTLTALVLAVVCVPLQAAAQEASTATVLATNPGLVISTPIAAISREDTEEIKQLQTLQQQAALALGKKQSEDLKAFLDSARTKPQEEMRRLYKQLRSQQDLERVAFNKDQRARIYVIGLKRHEANMALRREQLAQNVNISPESREKMLSTLDTMVRASMEKQYKRMEEAEAEYEKVRYDYSLKPEKRRKKLEEIRKKLAERNKKEDAGILFR